MIITNSRTLLVAKTKCRTRII